MFYENRTINNKKIILNTGTSKKIPPFLAERKSFREEHLDPGTNKII